MWEMWLICENLWGYAIIGVYFVRLDSEYDILVFLPTILVTVNWLTVEFLLVPFSYNDFPNLHLSPSAICFVFICQSTNTARLQVKPFHSWSSFHDQKLIPSAVHTQYHPSPTCNVSSFFSSHTLHSTSLHTPLNSRSKMNRVSAAVTSPSRLTISRLMAYILPTSWWTTAKWTCYFCFVLSECISRKTLDLSLHITW